MLTALSDGGMCKDHWALECQPGMAEEALPARGPGVRPPRPRDPGQSTSLSQWEALSTNEQEDGPSCRLASVVVVWAG